MSRSMILGGGIGSGNTSILFRMFHVLIFKNYTIPVIFCGCEIWFLTSRKHKLRVFMSGVVRRIFDM